MNYNKITEGNAFALCIRQAVWHSIGGQIYSLQADELMDIELRVGQGSKTTAERYEVSAEGDTIKADMPATLKRGVYKTWLTAVFNGRMVSSNCEAAFEVVPFDVHYPAFAPAKIEGAQAVYLQGISLNDSELEAEKMRYKALIKQKEDEIAMLAKEREKLTNVALQLDGVDESLDGISETLDGVAKEDTQLEIKKALDLVKAEISVEDKLNIRAAIELKGGQSVYKNPDNPALLELAKNVGTIPQKFMTLEPEGVRYDDPIEWHAFKEEVASAVSAARALQNKIDAEGGIPSIQNADVRYKGFILVDYASLFSFDETQKRDYINLSFMQADAFLIGYNDSEKTLVEKIDSDELKYYINIASFRDNQDIFIAYLYKDDIFTANLDFANRFVKSIIIGGHPSSIIISSASIQYMVQLNVTENTFMRLWDGKASEVDYLYTRCLTGKAEFYKVRFVYTEQLQYMSDTIKYQMCVRMYAPNLRSMSTIDDSGNVTASYDMHGPNTLYAPNLQYGSVINGLFFIDLPVRYIYSSGFGYGSPSSINVPYLEEIIGGYIDIYKSTSISNSNRLSYLNAPNLKKITFPEYGAILRNCKLIEKLELPELTYMETALQVYVTQNCDRLTEIILPKLGYFITREHGGRECINGSPLLKKIILGNVNSNTIWGCIGANDFIHFEFTEPLEYSINMTNWRPTNAINDTISTLVEDGEEFANNREKFLWNFRNYIIAMLQDYAGTGETRTLTLHSMVANVLTDEDKLAITNKGWILSIV